MAESGVYITLESDWSDVERLVEKIETAPSDKTELALERVLSQAYGITQTVVHVITGRLKASGMVTSRSEGPVWEGEIHYGGTAEVDYAFYEANRNGTHNFALAAFEFIGPAAVQAIEETWLD